MLRLKPLFMEPCVFHTLVVCTLSNHMSMRDANRGGCSQSCRWKYDLYDMPFGKERKSLKGEIPEEFSMSAVDMSMIDHIPDMIENGVDSLKIEGRMKSIHYVSTVTNCYKAAVDAYLESPEKFEAIKQDLIDEMWKVAQRELATGFYYGTPSEMSSCLVLVVKFLSISLSLKWFLTMMRHKQQPFVNGMSLTKATKLSFMAQVSVILKHISKICMMPKAIKLTAHQIRWNS